MRSAVQLCAFVCLATVHGWIQTKPSARRGTTVLPSNDGKTNALFAQKGDETTGKKDNKAMAFLRKIGKVGGVINQDFVNSMGVDEGPAGKTAGTASGMDKPFRKARSAYKSCTDSGVIDDLSEIFPFTSSGTQWSGFTDRVMGGVSSGSIHREEYDGKMANVLRGKVSLDNNGGFVQMATDLANDPSRSQVVDASEYDGIELDVRCDGSGEKESFNIHLKNADCVRQFSSFRASFNIDTGEWTTVRIPWSDFLGKGPGAEDNPFDVSTLRRIGIVAIGREMDVEVGVSGVRFYSVI